MGKDLSLLIPARNEMFLKETIQDALKNSEADTDIIVVLDGAWPQEPIPQYERVNIIYLNKSIGQRAATNLAAKLSKAKYVMKCDAHCAFDKGFDAKMIAFMEKVGDDVTSVPIMRNLWAFDWKCTKCGKRWYQGPTPIKCQETNFKGTRKPCTGTKFIRKMLWTGKSNPQSTSYCFDTEPHFQYFNEYKNRPEYSKSRDENGYTETMSLQGSCWMVTRDNYWELNICDEKFGSWGSQGIEVASKTWLSGGRVLVNHNTWYAHMFRTQGGDFGFPYPISTKDQEKAKAYARDLFFNNKWEKQIHPLSWLVEKFGPVKGWTEKDLEKLKKNKFRFKESVKSKARVEIEPSPSSVREEPAVVQAVALPIKAPPPAASLIQKPEERKEIQLDIQLQETFVKSNNGITKQDRKPVAKPTVLKKVTIIGYGWVGKSVHTLFPDAALYDPPKYKSKRKANKGDVAFICVPTPSIQEGKLDISIVEEVVAWCEAPILVIRSTVNPGTTDYLSKKYNKRILVQPEYLGETPNHPLRNEKEIPFVIIGGKPEDLRLLIDLYATVYNANIKIRQVTALEAEVIKLTENRAIAFKVAQCQELYDVCEKAGIDYYTIRDAVYGDDPRFTLWWTLVYPHKRGFNSKCIPKDVYAWCAWAESLGIQPHITQAILKKNKEWISLPAHPQTVPEGERKSRIFSQKLILKRLRAHHR